MVSLNVITVIVSNKYITYRFSFKYDSLTNFSLGLTALAVTDILTSIGFSVVLLVASCIESPLISSCSVGTPQICCCSVDSSTCS